MYPSRVFGVPRCVLFIEVSSIYIYSLYIQPDCIYKFCGVYSPKSVSITKLSINLYLTVYVHLTHCPGSQGWAPRCPIRFVFVCTVHVWFVGSEFPSFLLFLYD